MSDVITLTGLRVWGWHGVFEHEKRDGQEFVVDVRMWADLSAAAATDDLSATIDYGHVAGIVAEVVGGRPYDLIEAVAGVLADRIVDRPRVAAAEVTVHKPAAPIPQDFADVSVTITRTARERS